MPEPGPQGGRFRLPETFTLSLPLLTMLVCPLLVYPEKARAALFSPLSNSALTAPVELDDFLLAGGALAVWGIQGILTTTSSFPQHCLWCNTLPIDVQFRHSFFDPARKARWQSVSDRGLIPLEAGIGLITLGTIWQTRQWEPLFTVAESLLVAGSVNSLSKALFARPRPYSRSFADDKQLSVSDLASFGSGHASFAFSMATTLTLTAHDLGWPTGWIALPSFAVASTVAIARIGADKHWLTDVLFGAFTGTASVALVWWLRQPDEEHSDAGNGDIAIRAGPGSVELLYAFR